MKLEHLKSCLTESAVPSAADKAEYVQKRLADLKKDGLDLPAEISERFLANLLEHAYSYGWMDGHNRNMGQTK